VYKISKCVLLYTTYSVGFICGKSNFTKCLNVTKQMFCIVLTEVRCEATPKTPLTLAESPHVTPDIFLTPMFLLHSVYKGCQLSHWKCLLFSEFWIWDKLQLEVKHNIFKSHPWRFLCTTMWKSLELKIIFTRMRQCVCVCVCVCSNITCVIKNSSQITLHQKFVPLELSHLGISRFLPVCRYWIW